MRAGKECVCQCVCVLGGVTGKWDAFVFKEEIEWQGIILAYKLTVFRATAIAQKYKGPLWGWKVIVGYRLLGYVCIRKRKKRRIPLHRCLVFWMAAQVWRKEEKREWMMEKLSASVCVCVCVCVSVCQGAAKTFYLYLFKLVIHSRNSLSTVTSVRKKHRGKPLLTLGWCWCW